MPDSHVAARRRLEQRMPEGRPLVLPHSHIRRLLEKRPTLLILSRQLLDFEATRRDRRLPMYEIHDAQTVRRNQQHRKDSRFDLQSNPHVLTIEVTEVDSKPLAKVELVEANAAGYKTTEDLLTDWHARRRALDLTLTVYLSRFKVVDVLYLHRLVHRGYTTDPAHAAEEQAEALSRQELDEMAKRNRERYREMNADRVAQQEARSLANQLRDAQRRAQARGLDINPEVTAIRRQLDQIRSKLTEAA